jgi:hypothetical protein
VAVTANGATLQARGFDPAAGRRITTNTGTISGAVDLSFVFNKPMRVVGTDGSGALLTPTMGSSDVQISSSAGIFGPPRWNHTSRWAGDTMTVRFQPHQGLSSGVYTVSINLVDLVGMELDGDPGSVADWSRDGWVGWEADRADTGLVLQYVEDGGTPGADGWELR